MRLVWSDEPSMRFGGDYYHLRGAKPGPVPAHEIEIWLGVGGPRALALAGRAADGWLPSLGPIPKSRLLEMHARVDQAATEAGRDPSTIRRLLNVSGPVTADSQDGWAAELIDLAIHYRIGTFIFASQGDAEADQLRRFAEEVVPAVREQVGR